jgi:hypothetical protein
MNKPSCIKCGRRRGVIALANGFKCGGCGALFDSDPDEGGTHGNNPAARMMREENLRDRRRAKLGERRA